jgi:2-dehydropantoate 2-reductase
MRIVVVGPGALGSLFAATLTLHSGGAGKTTDDIWLLDHDRSRARLLADQGLLLERGGERFTCPVRATSSAAEVGEADLVLLCVKSYDVASGLQRAASLLRSDTLLLALQNGIAHLDLVETVARNCLAAVGVTSLGATLLAPGHVSHGGSGRTRVGFLHPPTAYDTAGLRAMADLLNGAGLETEIVADMRGQVWAKLLVNVGINGLTAIQGCRNGGLLDMPEVMTQLAAAVREAAAVARALGIDVVADPVAATLGVCQTTRENISSMLQDVRHRRPTEIDAINGAIVALGHQLHIPVPTNEYLVRRVKEIEHNYSP